MATLTHAQLVTLWEAEGGNPLVADVAAAIAQAESGGCQYAKAGPTDDRPVKECTYRQTTTESSYGLWQINRMAHPTYSPDSLYTPVGNAQAAIAISGNGASFQPWTTYTNGAYKQYLQTIPGPFPGPVGGGIVSPAAAAPSGHSGYADFRNSLGRHLPTQLEESRRLGLSTLRALGSRRKVGR